MNYIIVYTTCFFIVRPNTSQVFHCLLYVTKGLEMEFDGEADQRSKGWSAFCSTVIAVDLLKTSAIFGGAFLKYPNN